MAEPLESQGGLTPRERAWNINKSVGEVENPDELKWMQTQLESGGQADDPKVAQQIGKIASKLQKLLEGK